MKFPYKIFLALLILNSCSGESNSDSDSSLSQSLENTQWVFDNYNILRKDELSANEFGYDMVNFTMEELEASNNYKWKDFVIIFKSNNVGFIMETIYLSDEQLLPMEWKVVDGNTIRIIYQRKTPQTNSYDSIIVEFKNAKVLDSKLSFEFEYIIAMIDMKIFNQYGIYTFK